MRIERSSWFSDLLCRLFQTVPSVQLTETFLHHLSGCSCRPPTPDLNIEALCSRTSGRIRTERILHHPTSLNIELGGAGGFTGVAETRAFAPQVVQDCFRPPSQHRILCETLRSQCGFSLCPVALEWTSAALACCIVKANLPSVSWEVLGLWRFARATDFGLWRRSKTCTEAQTASHSRL